jgi:molecular chaperone GrpE
MTETDTKAAAPAETADDSEEARREDAIEQLSGREADVERLEAEKADLTDRLLRLAADMENLRRRTERDVSDARRYAVTQFAADMLLIADNLKRALEAVPADARQSADAAIAGVIEGVEMTAREMDRLLAKNGVARIAAKGERFDPHKHEAMFEAPDQNVPAGTVIEVIQDGYQIGDRVLRAARVGVAKGGGAARTSD